VEANPLKKAAVMKKTMSLAVLILMSAAALLPMACGKNLAPSASGPVTEVQVVPTGTSTPTNLPGTSTPTGTPTPNPFGGFVWGAALANNASPGSTQFPERQSPTGLIYNNAMWLIGGFNTTNDYLNDVWSSTNGVSWTNVLPDLTGGSSTQFIGRTTHTSLVYNNAMWVIGGANGLLGGYLNDVWTSTNGSVWTQTASGASANIFPARDSHASVVFNNTMWVIGGVNGTGFLNDVWASTDGANWYEATPGAAFSGRFGHACVVFNNAMWVIGGQGSSSYLNDVWTSTNGVYWTQVLANTASPGATQFSQRNYFASFVYNNAMWVVGGFAGGVADDVWYSTNGSTWTEATAAAAFSKRFDLSGLVYNNLMWVISGSASSGGLNDVWYSPY
jgi:leucine-zipper-like transcriptional regulator 1